MAMDRVPDHKPSSWIPVDSDPNLMSSEELTKAFAKIGKKEYTGGSVSYYQVHIEKPLRDGALPYIAECNDIIEALNMNYAEGNAFKAIWRSCAARHLNLSKEGYKDTLYDAEKVVFFGKRLIIQAKDKK